MTRFSVRVAALAALALGACGRTNEAPVAAASAADASALRAFLDHGPEAGVWEMKGLSQTRTFWVAPHPADKDRVLVAEKRKEGAVEASAVSKEQFARLLLEAPADLFLGNYAPSGAAADAPARDGTAARRLEWVPRREHDGETSRRTWFDLSTGAVIQVEDRSHQGHVVRGVYRVAAAAPEDPSFAEAAKKPVCATCVPSADVELIVEQAPFAVVVPAYVPPGYAMIRAEFGQRCVACEESAPPVPFVSLLYSDGVGLISVGIALRSDLDAIERSLAAMPSDPDDPEACPTLPPATSPIAEGKVVVRRRTDKCRTVLRVDDFHGVSVAVLSRNELPGDEYLKVVQSLTLIEKQVEKKTEEPVKDR